MRLSFALRLLILLALLGSLLPAQGWKRFDDQESGLRFKHPKTFTAVPLKPSERVLITTMKRDKPLRAKSRDRHRSPEEFTVFLLRDQATGAGSSKEPVTSLDDVVDRRNAVHDIKTLMATRFRGWKAVPVESRGLREGESEFRVEPARGRSRGRKGYLFAKKVPGYTWGVVGYMDEEVERVFERDYRKIGRSIERPKGYRAVKNKAEDFYKFKDLLDIPFRVKARQQMVRGWKAHDTQNYFVVYHTDNFKLVNKITTDLEIMRSLFQERFTPVAPIEAVSVVRICADIKEYYEYGGPPGSAGYWHPIEKELVLYDMTKTKRTTKSGRTVRGSRSDSYLTLYHEAFHQYVFYALGRMSPDYWFNEGNADYFSGATVYSGSKRVKAYELHPWRIPAIAAMLQAERRITLKQLVDAKRKQYYDPRLVGFYYAFGWSFCYFLHEVSADAAKEAGIENENWSSLVDRYYAALKDARKKQVEPLGDDTPLGERQAAEARARTTATEVAFKGVDRQKLEAAWVAWLQEITADEQKKIEKRKRAAK
jgi:hypothetical protein